MKKKTLFLVTLPCHAELKGTKSVSKSSTKLTPEDIDIIFAESYDLQTLNSILENDISEVVDYIWSKIGTKSVQKVSKSAQKVSKSARKVSKSIEIIDFLQSEQSREEILKHLGLINHTSNFKNYIKPLLELEIIQLTIPDKPKSQLQKYTLTEKGRKLIK